MKKLIQIKPSPYKEDTKFDGEGQPILDSFPKEEELYIKPRAHRFGTPKSHLRSIDRAQLYEGPEALIVNTNSRMLKSNPHVADPLCEIIWDRGGHCFITRNLSELRTAVEQIAEMKIGRIYVSGGDGTIFLIMSAANQIFIPKGLPLPEIVVLGGGTAEDLLNWLPGDYRQGNLLKTMKGVVDNLDQGLVAVSHLKTIKIRVREQSQFVDLFGNGDLEVLSTAFGTGTIAEFLKIYNQIPNKAIRHVWTVFYKAALSALSPISLRISLKELEEVRQALESDQHESLKNRYRRGLIGLVIRLYCLLPGKWLKKHFGQPWLLRLLAAQKYFVLFTRHQELVSMDDHHQRKLMLRTVMAGVPGSYSKIPGLRKHCFRLFPKSHLLEEYEGFNVMLYDASLFRTFIKFLSHFLFRTRPGNRYFVRKRLLLEGVDGKDLVATLNGETFTSDRFDLSPGPVFRVISPVSSRRKVKLKELQKYYIPTGQ